MTTRSLTPPSYLIDMPIQGSLSTMPVPELLMWISQCQKTGTLEIRTSEPVGYLTGRMMRSAPCGTPKLIKRTQQS
jgi:hypothetical protein